MDFNWVDWAIVGVTALGLLFGLMWERYDLFLWPLRRSGLGPTTTHHPFGG